MRKARTAEVNKKYNIATIAICVAFALAIIWQGAFFPMQFLPLLMISFITFAFIKKPLLITLNVVLLFALVVVMFVSLLLLAQEPQIGIREWLRYLLIPLSLLFFTTTKDKSDWYMRAFYAGIFAVAIFGLMALAGGIVIPFGVIEHSGRLQSTVQYANVTALFMLIGILYSVEYFNKTKKWCYPIYAAGFAYCLYLTGSRTTFVLFFLIAVVFVLTKVSLKPRLAALGLLTLMFAGLIAFGGRIVQISLTEPTLIERVITWQDGLRIALYYPWFGLGIGNWQFMQFFYQSAPYGVRYIHNFYVQLLVDGGFLAAIIFIAIICNALWRGLKGKNIHFFVVLAIAIHSFFDFSMTFGGVILILAFSMAQIPDLTVRAIDAEAKPLSSTTNRLRFMVLIPAIALLIMWVFESNYTVPDPLGNRLTESRQLYADGEYMLAIERKEELLSLWRFNPHYQTLYFELLTSAVNRGVISLEEKKLRIHEAEQNREHINPLYLRYIRRN